MPITIRDLARSLNLSITTVSRALDGYTDVAAQTRQRVLEDPSQIIGIRPYQHGDGLRRIHWRATAHTGRFQSKLFEVSAQVECVLALNLRRVLPDEE